MPMMRLLRFPFMLLIAALGLGVGTSSRPVGAERPLLVSRLYFLPFHVTTFVPVTLEGIEQSATLEVSLVGSDDGRPHPFVRSLRGTLGAHAMKTKFNEESV